VVERVGEEMGWKMQYNDNKNWDLKWNDCAITSDFLAKMASHQKINHFPGMNTLHRKNNLAKNLYRMYDDDP
jgi:tubulin polyglutamylase TTLL6/13